MLLRASISVPKSYLGLICMTSGAGAYREAYAACAVKKAGYISIPSLHGTFLSTLAFTKVKA